MACCTQRDWQQMGHRLSVQSLVYSSCISLCVRCGICRMNVALCCIHLSILHSNLKCKVTELREDFGEIDCALDLFLMCILCYFVEVIVKCFCLSFVPRVCYRGICMANLQSRHDLNSRKARYIFLWRIPGVVFSFSVALGIVFAAVYVKCLQEVWLSY